MYRTASIYCCFVHDVCIRSVARYLISMEHGDRAVFVARPFLCCDYRSIIRTIFTRGEFIVIHLIQRSNRIDTSVNDHRFLLAFSLSLSLYPSIIISFSSSSNFPRISPSHSFLSFLFPSFPHFNNIANRELTTR